MATRSVQRVNYDLIAHLYGEPSRDHELDSHPVQLLSERGDRSGARLQILETGYSTGKQLAAGRMELFIETKNFDTGGNTMSALFVNSLVSASYPLSDAITAYTLQTTNQSNLSWFSTLLILLGVIYAVWVLISWNAAQPLEYTFEHSSDAHNDGGAGALPATKGDNLELIEGIGPKIAGTFRQAGITTFAQLSEKEPNSLEEILRTAGIRLADPTTWPQQAELAAAGEWETLERLQASLKGGR